MTATVLLVATATRWLGTARIPRGLAKAGFEVALLTPRNSSQTGLATVVRYIHQAEVARFSAMLVEGFAMSGFSGIEFRVEETTGEAYLLEINRRITPGVRGVRTGGHAAGDRRPAASGARARHASAGGSRAPRWPGHGARGQCTGGVRRTAKGGDATLVSARARRRRAPGMSCNEAPARRGPGNYRAAAVTRQTLLPTSSATNKAPCLSMATPTGRPRASPSSLTKPVSTLTGSPAGLPPLNGTKITL